MTITYPLKEHYMKISKYNVIHSDSEKVLIFNTLTSAIVKLRPEDWNIIEKGIYSNVETGVISQLQSMGIISDDTENQIMSYKYKFLKTAFEAKKPFLYIAPTMRCNFGCFYCFEQGNKHQGLMSEETALRIIQFLKNYNKDNVSIVWFGENQCWGLIEFSIFADSLRKQVLSIHLL